jgi:hypothetical protein
VTSIAVVRRATRSLGLLVYDIEGTIKDDDTVEAILEEAEENGESFASVFFGRRIIMKTMKIRMSEVLSPQQERYHSVTGMWEWIAPPQQGRYHFITSMWECCPFR